MAVFTGQAGDVAVAGGYVANVKEWNMTIDVDIHDSTVFIPPAVWRTKEGGLLTASGSFSCYADTAVDLVLPGITGAATFTLTGAQTITGDIILTNFTIGVDVGGGLSEVMYTYESTGVIAIN